MSKALFLSSVVLLAVVAGLLALQTFQHPAETWSYAVITPKDSEMIETLNQAGSQGWEVVSSRRASNGERGDAMVMSYELILKRRGAPVKMSIRVGQVVSEH